MTLDLDPNGAERKMTAKGTDMKIGLGSKVKLARDNSRVGEVVRLHRLGGTLYATVSWVADQTWSTDAPVAKLVAA